MQDGTLNVLARNSVRGGGRVFSPNTLETFATIPSATNFLKYQTKRELHIDFANAVSTISLEAVSAATPGQRKQRRGARSLRRQSQSARPVHGPAPSVWVVARR